MAKILVTGSTDGLGRHTALTLAKAGHLVVLHARNRERAEVARAAVPTAVGVLVGDFTSLLQTRAVAVAANALGRFDAVVHNAGIGGGVAERIVTGDGLERTFQVNALAPYLLCSLMPLPDRLIYLTSGLEANGRLDLADLQHEQGTWRGMQAYSDSKLALVLLAFAIARRHPELRSNVVDPGWIKTRMGGVGATGELPEGVDTQVWLASSDEPAALVSGRYFRRRRQLRANRAGYDTELQERLLAACAQLTGAVLN